MPRAVKVEVWGRPVAEMLGKLELGLDTDGGRARLLVEYQSVFTSAYELRAALEDAFRVNGERCELDRDTRVVATKALEAFLERLRGLAWECPVQEHCHETAEEAARCLAVYQEERMAEHKARQTPEAVRQWERATGRGWLDLRSEP